MNFSDAELGIMVLAVSELIYAEDVSVTQRSLAFAAYDALRTEQIVRHAEGPNH